MKVAERKRGHAASGPPQMQSEAFWQQERKSTRQGDAISHIACATQIPRACWHQAGQRAANRGLSNISQEMGCWEGSGAPRQ
eukprot:13164164-Alexandrium_andersonii.AAC.1